MPPGDVVVSTSRYADPIERGTGVPEFDGVREADAGIVRVPDTEDVVVLESVPVGEVEVVGVAAPVLEPEAPEEGVCVPVAKFDGVPDGEAVRELVVVTDAVRDFEGVTDDVTVRDDVDESDDPADGVCVPDGVGDGDGWTMPVTRKPHCEADPGLNELSHVVPEVVVVNTPTNDNKLWSGGATVSP